MSVYLDTSVLISHFVDDANSDRADGLIASLSDEVGLSDLSAAEFASSARSRPAAGEQRSGEHAADDRQRNPEADLRGQHCDQRLGGVAFPPIGPNLV